MEKDKSAQQILQVLTASLKEYFKSATQEDIVKGFQTQLKLILELEKRLVEKVTNTLAKIESSNQKQGEEQKVALMGIEKSVNSRLSQLKDGHTPVKGIDYTDGKDADENLIISTLTERLPKIEDLKKEITGEVVRDSLELLQGEERLDKKAIKGLEDLEKEVKEVKGRPTQRVIAGPSANSVNYEDLSSQCDGSTRTFTTPMFRKVIALLSTEAPIIYRPTTDFTIGRNSITLTSQVSAPATGQSLILLYVI